MTLNRHFQERFQEKPAYGRTMFPFIWVVSAVLMFAVSGQGASAQTLRELAETNSVSERMERMPIYSVVTNRKVADVATNSAYRVVSSNGARSRIQFVRPTVKGWVSADFVDINQIRNLVVVNVDALNFRVNPNIKAAKLTQVFRAYQSELLDQRDGFVQIYAPVAMEFLIDSSNLTTTTQSSSPMDERNWSLGSESGEPQALDDAGQTTLGSVPEAAAKEKPISRSTTPVVPEPIVAEQASNHLLAPGDSISLLVFGEPDLSVSNVRVPQGGRVSFPLIGSVVVLGKTTAEVENEVAGLLSQGYVRNPRLSVSIFSYRPIFIRGEVKSTGSFPYSEGLTIAKAIALAGGVSASANASGVSITRDGVVVANGLLVDSQARVASGDIVSVAADQEVKNAESSFVYLHGEVASPGAYEFQSGLTVEKAVVLAGGFTLRASTRKINVSRYESADESGEPLEMKRVKLFTPVKPGDVIKVGASWF